MKKHPNLKGLRAKNSYTLGLAKGMTKKLKEEKEAIKATSRGKDLVRLEKKLISHVHMAFPKLSRQQASSGTYNPDALSLGHRDGQNIDYKKAKGSSKSNKNKTLNLPFFK